MPLPLSAFSSHGAAVVVSWPDAMLASYRTLHPEQATWFDGAGAAVETELLSRLQPGGYLHTTFGPGGQNKVVCDFVFILKTVGDITTRPITKSGAVLRWDIDGTVTTQNDLPSHTLGAGAGILTCSTTDGWGGLTDFQIYNNQFSGAAPLWDFPNVASFYIHLNQFSGAAPLWDFPNVASFYIHLNQFSGTAPLWDFPAVTDFRIHNNQFSGTAPLWDFPSITSFQIHSNQFSGAAPLWDFPNVTIFRISGNQFSGAAPLWDFPNVTTFRIYSNQFSDFSAFLANLHTLWSTKVGACNLQIQSNSATLSGTYADEDPPTTDKGYIYELANDPESTGYPIYTITYDA